jgi:SAM-dependent methyltransferase
MYLPSSIVRWLPSLEKFSDPFIGLPNSPIVESLRRTRPARLPPVGMMNVIGSPDRRHFLRNMALFAAEVASYCQLNPRSRVLDLGCGTGRIALGLARLLGPGARYVGLDVWAEGIAWCRENISSQHPNFEFHVVSAADNHYFPGRDAAAGVDGFSMARLQESSMDAAFALSLFTHLEEADLLGYLRETRRVLTPGGLFHATFFVIDDDFRAYVERTGKHARVLQNEAGEGAWYAYRDAPHQFFAGFSRELLLRHFGNSGFEVVEEQSGCWKEAAGARRYQDLFLLRRA